MFYKNILFITIFLFLTNCTTGNVVKNKPSTVIGNTYSNKGFALVYSENLYKQKIVTKKIAERSLTVFQKNLKTNTRVKITNMLNNKSLIGTVGKNAKYPSFNNAVISMRIEK
jgi:choline kinase